MTATNGWPGKPGVPLNPEKDGWHWVRRLDQKQAHIQRWIGGQFWLGPSFGSPQTDMARYEYLGPALTPDEVTALQKRVAELETALQFIKDAPDEERKPNWNNMGSYEAGLRYCAAFARAAMEGGKDE